MIAAAHAGLVTGENVDNNMPKRSFIIPAPGTSQGYIAVSYAKVEPWATLIASTVDAVNGVKREIMTFGAYDKFIKLDVNIDRYVTFGQELQWPNAACI